MANQLRAVVTADIRQFTRAMSIVGLSASSAAAAAVGSFAAITTSVLALDRAAVDAAKEYETLGLAFRFAAREGEDINAQFSKLIDFADRTPFETRDLVKYSIQLKNVTSGLFGTTEQIEEMAGALAKAQLLGRDQQFINSLGRIISAFQTGSGQIKRYTQTLLNTGAISAETAKSIKELSAQGGSASDVIAVLTQEFQKSNQAAIQFARTAQGLESTLKSRFQITLAELGGKDGLENYKLIIDEINTLLVGLRETEAFADLSNAIGDLNAEILELVKTEGFRAFVIEAIRLTAGLVRSLAMLIDAVEKFSSLEGVKATFSPFGTLAGIIAGTGDVGTDIEKARRAQTAEQNRDMKKLVNNTGISANEMNPQAGAVIK